MKLNPDNSYPRYGQLRRRARRLPGYDIENVRVAWASAPTATGNYNTIADIQAGQFWYFYKEHGTSIVRLHNIEFYDWALGGNLAETDKYVLNPFTDHSFMGVVPRSVRGSYTVHTNHDENGTSWVSKTYRD